VKSNYAFCVAHAVSPSDQKLLSMTILEASHYLLSNGQACVHRGASIELLLSFFLFFPVFLKKKYVISICIYIDFFHRFLIVICFVFNIL